MVSTRNTQSLSEFRKNAAATIDRLNKTGELEILTVNGETRAVLAGPAVYDELGRKAEISSDVAFMRRAMKEIDEGKGQEAGAFFDALHEKLLAMKAAREKARQ